MNCCICGNTKGNRSYDVREMMFGTREVFTYFQCASCGCLQIAEIPPDMSRHYPSDYCSFKRSPTRRFANPMRNLFRVPRYRYAALGKGFFGRLLCAVAPKEKLHRLSDLKLTEDSHVLDVGCGTGSLLYTLRTLGIVNLLGIDPYLVKDIEYGSGLRILRKSIHEMDGTWDLVMFNYSLEHMPEQVKTLSAAGRLLADAGTCLVRIPLVSSYAWEHYGVNWVALDAPRHFYLHSAASFELLVQKSGLRIEKAVYDSDDFQFTGSELYARGIPLVATRPRSMFTRGEIRRFRRRADELNREGRGDQATFHLRKK